MRVAIYFTPDQNTPLTRTAADWLGRDPFGGQVEAPASVAGLSAAERAFHTAAPRRYGFHATLKAPFRLVDGQSLAGLDRAVQHFAARTAPFIIPQLVVAQIDGFFALVPAENLPALNRFADDVVIAFEPYRAPLTESELARRNAETLSPVEFRNLLTWGYPYVFESFRFHMTLSGRAGHSEGRLREAIETTFAPVLAQPIAVDGLALFVELEPGAPFEISAYHRLGAGRHRKTG